MNPRHGLLALRNEKAKLLARIRNINPTLAADLDQMIGQMDWYKIRNSATNEDTTEVFIYDEIGGYCGIDAGNFVQELDAITTPKITVRVNSPGGSLFDGIAIYNSLVSHPAYITAEVDALAASAASIIVMGADKVRMKVGAQLMMHDAMGVEMGNAQQMREMSDFLERQSNNIATIYAERAGGDPVDWRAKMLAETWYFANEAVNAGLADEVFKRPENADPDAPDEPDEDDPNEDGEEAESDIEMSEEDELAILMRAPHKLTNRGFKYRGRNRAPDPLGSVRASTMDDDDIARFIAHFSKGKV